MATNQPENDLHRETLGIQGDNSIPHLTDQELTEILKKPVSQKKEEKPPAPPEQNQE